MHISWDHERDRALLDKIKRAHTEHAFQFEQVEVHRCADLLVRLDCDPEHRARLLSDVIALATPTTAEQRTT